VVEQRFLAKTLLPLSCAVRVGIWRAITHMAHGTPLATGESEDECGAAGPLLLEVGISSSHHIAKFFGLAMAGSAMPRQRIVSTPE
jgi:hypothetical protein